MDNECDRRSHLPIPTTNARQSKIPAYRSDFRGSVNPGDYGLSTCFMPREFVKIAMGSLSAKSFNPCNLRFRQLPNKPPSA